MTWSAGAFWVCCLVLVAAGSTKLADPAPLARALAGLGVAAGERALVVARTLGAAEVFVGVAALAIGGPVTAGAAAALYVVFAAVVLVARSRGLASCGCYGERSGPPTQLHAGLNVVSAAVCGVAVVEPVAPVADAVVEAGGSAVWGLAAVVVVAGVVVWLEAR